MSNHAVLLCGYCGVKEHHKRTFTKKELLSWRCSVCGQKDWKQKSVKASGNPFGYEESKTLEKVDVDELVALFTEYDD